MPQQWIDDDLKGAEAYHILKDDNYLALTYCQKHKPHPIPTYTVDRV
jgi:hypothetical protein